MEGFLVAKLYLSKLQTCGSVMILHQTGKFCCHNMLLLPHCFHIACLLCMALFGLEYFVKNCNVILGKVQLSLGLSYDVAYVSHQNGLNV